MITRQTVTAKTPWLERARIGLDLSHEKMAAVCGITEREIKLLCSVRGKRELGEDDEVFERLLVYINKLLGNGLTIRVQLHQKLQKDREDRLRRRVRMKG